MLPCTIPLSSSPSYVLKTTRHAWILAQEGKSDTFAIETLRTLILLLCDPLDDWIEKQGFPYIRRPLRNKRRTTSLFSHPSSCRLVSLWIKLWRKCVHDWPYERHNENTTDRGLHFHKVQCLPSRNQAVCACFPCFILLNDRDSCSIYVLCTGARRNGGSSTSFQN